MTAGHDLFEQAAVLRRRGERFALATVVRSRRPASARPGDRALVLADGTLEGWVGGSCAQDLVRREALRALAEGTPRLLRLSPEGGPGEEGVVSERMTCHSGGTLEVYVEPFLPPPRLIVMGESPVARALAALAPPLGFALVHQPDPAAPLDLEDAADAWVVVASMGDDEQALEAALRSGAPYVALVASPRRAAAVRDFLREEGLDEATVARLKAPAGLDLGARSGPEVALSILAEIVQRRNAAQGTHGDVALGLVPRPLPGPKGDSEVPSPATATDPVCGMEVEVATARWTSEYQGRTIVFCAAGCKRRFDREPSAFLEAGSASSAG